LTPQHVQHKGGMNIFTHGQQSQDTLKGDRSWTQTKKTRRALIENDTFRVTQMWH